VFTHADTITVAPADNSSGKWFVITFCTRDGNNKPHYVVVAVPAEALAILYAESGAALGIPAVSEVASA
jgi:hypothetical protein